MIRVAICSDDESLCTKLRMMVKNAMYYCSMKPNIKIYSPCKDLSITLNNNKNKIESFYNVFFIDMDSTSINGVDLGCKIRKKFGLETSQIIYLSSKQENVFHVFKTTPIGFLLKPTTYEAIREVLNNVFFLNIKSNETFKYHFGRELHKTLLKDIIYFQSHNRIVEIIMKNGIASFYGTLNEVYNQIDNSNFLFIHKSYLINCQYIKQFEYYDIIMSNNDILPISQINRKSVRSLFLQLEEIGSISRFYES